MSRSRATVRFLSPIIIKIHAPKPLSIAIPGNKRRSISEKLLIELLASLAGALFACNFYVIKPDQFTFNKSIDILVMVVFGGMGSMTSSVLAAVAIGIINVVLANFSEIRMIIYGLALVGIMIFKPTGILGTKELSFKKLFDKRKEKSA